MDKAARLGFRRVLPGTRGANGRRPRDRRPAARGARRASGARRLKRLALVGLALLALVAVGPLLLRDDDSDSAESSAVVARVIDGDTLELADGSRVRLVQIDTPEAGKECYAESATALTRRLLPPGTRVNIEPDPRLDRVDRYRRRLAYVRKGGENVNVTLVRRGAASVWFFHGARGRYADELLAAAQEARADRRGLWSSCPLARFDPARALATGSG